VIGYPKPQDGAAFTGEFVLNECGTIGSPADCFAKDMEVSTLPFQTEDMRAVGASPMTSVIIHQVTLKIEGGGYETWACAVAVNGDDTRLDDAWDCRDRLLDYTAHIKLVTGQKYRFATDVHP